MQGVFSFNSSSEWIAALLGVGIIASLVGIAAATLRRHLAPKGVTARQLASTPADRPIGGRAKRVMDTAIGLLAIILLAPLMLMVSALVRLTIGGPIILGHQRVGFAGATFTCYKFRTRVANAEEVPSRRSAQHSRCKLRDPRIGYVSDALQKSGLDNLPQLFNVLRGDMSMVGPRPLTTSELQRYGKHVKVYVWARPGLTGIWYTTNKSQLSYCSHISLDRCYVSSWSIWLDATILIKTIPALLSQDTAE